MELETFIKQTLLDIRNGLHAANEAIAVAEKKVLGQDIGAHFLMGPYEDRGGYINFDVAVTVSGGNSASAEGGIRIAIAKLGSELTNTSKQEHVSRIQFSVKPSKFTG